MPGAIRWPSISRQASSRSEGADVLLLDTPAATLNADQAYDAQSYVVVSLALAGKSMVIPSNPPRKQRREDDRGVDQARHLIEHAYVIPRYRPPAVTRPRAMSLWQPVLSQQSCSIDERLWSIDRNLLIRPANTLLVFTGRRSGRRTPGPRSRDLLSRRGIQARISPADIYRPGEQSLSRSVRKSFDFPHSQRPLR
ncbi:protein of unknown function [Methylocaldum szegediense]|uniref:Uncharacterized protein n=1 Tax=Methylocaldum szegediense TaxID=73780 RepID=A0ABM9I230_9GAMM|nr:protein of unknown function [Methylocaldum szegediense]